MHREIIWHAGDRIGAEYLFLDESGDGIVADSVVFATRDAVPSRTRYRMEMDLGWNVRRVSVSVSNAGMEDRSLELVSDGEGHWQDGDGNPLAQFDDCLDIDVSATPFTNTLPIRRLELQSGQVEPIRVLYIHVPSLETSVWEQRYTGLEGGLVRYESVGSDFQRDLHVDDDGLVIDYPSLFRRVHIGSRS
jgi:hypothetical protein